MDDFKIFFSYFCKFFLDSFKELKSSHYIFCFWRFERMVLYEGKPERFIHLMRNIHLIYVLKCNKTDTEHHYCSRQFIRISDWSVKCLLMADWLEESYRRRFVFGRSTPARICIFSVCEKPTSLIYNWMKLSTHILFVVCTCCEYGVNGQSVIVLSSEGFVMRVSTRSKICCCDCGASRLFVHVTESWNRTIMKAAEDHSRMTQMS